MFEESLRESVAGVVKEAESGVFGGGCEDAPQDVDTGVEGCGVVNNSSATLLRLDFGVSATPLLGVRENRSVSESLNFFGLACCRFRHWRAATNCLCRSKTDSWRDHLSIEVHQKILSAP